MTATLIELEARVAALEAERADYRAVLAAINPLAENQRELVENQREHAKWLDRVESQLERRRAGWTGWNRSWTI